MTESYQMKYRGGRHDMFVLPGAGRSGLLLEGAARGAEVDFLKTLFSTKGLLIALYVLIGVFLNTASPHLPTTPDSVSSIHSWGQYIISVLFWPLSLWHPTFTLGKWTP